MCELDGKPSSAINAEPKDKPEVSMARELEKNLGYANGHIDPVALRLFILHRWSRITVLAHAIHDEY